MKEFFGFLPTGESVFLYPISCGALTAWVTDLGATLVKLYVPDGKGNRADVVLGYDAPQAYLDSTAYFGCTVGRNANRVKDGTFILNNRTYRLDANDGPNDLHSGFDGYHRRLWQVEEHTDKSIRFALVSPHEDQGFPGNARIRVTYTLESNGLKLNYEAISDKDTVFNLTNHSYFNLAGHDHPERAMAQTLCLPSRYFTLADSRSIPTGFMVPVVDTPMDFRMPKTLAQALEAEADFEPMVLQSGIDHNFEVFCKPCAMLCDQESGRCMAVETDLPGIQVYTANYTDERGKDGVHYGKRSGVALETQFYPDSVNHPEWKQPFVKAGHRYHTETTYRFFW